MKIILKGIFTALGTLLFLNGLIICFVSNINIGNFLCIALGLLIIFTTLFFKRLGRFLKVVFLAAIGVAVIFSSFLMIYGKTDNTTYKEDAVIVLGAAVHGKTPSRTLRHRLDTAAEYHKSNPEAIIVVSGGKGPQEDITEAEAMRLYLVEKGVDPQVIIMEAEATSTYENFKYSKKLLDKKLGKEYKTCFITNEYHILRALLCAEKAGLSDLTHLHSNTVLSYLTPGVLRECLAVLKYIILGN